VVQESGSGEKEPRDFARVDRLAQLGTLPHMSRDTGVSVREINDLFFAVGAMRPEIAALFGWTQGNVWLHERDRVYIAATKRVFPDLLAAIEELLANPLSVHMDQRSAHAAYVVITRATLRQHGMVTNNPNRLVDGVVKWIQVDDGAYLHLTHFSPVYQNQGLALSWQPETALLRPAPPARRLHRAARSQRHQPLPILRHIGAGAVPLIIRSLNEAGRTLTFLC
jgi:hypothetical protein